MANFFRVRSLFRLVLSTSCSATWLLLVPLLHGSQAVNAMTLRDWGRQLHVRDGGGLSINDTSDVGYRVTLTLAGQEFSVLIDTGSQDLWVATDDTSGFQDTGVSAEVDYAVGSIQGPVATAELQIAGFTVENQAFIAAPSSDTNPSGTGLIGLGPFIGSNVYAALGYNMTGNPPLDNIFGQDTGTPNYITIKLGRVSDPSVPFPGNFTVGEVLPEYSNITSQTQLQVVEDPEVLLQDQHWQVLLDADGIKVNGETVQTPSVAAVELGLEAENQLVVVFDTGFTFPQVPEYLSNAIYSKVSGARLENVTGVGVVWVIPCDADIDVSFTFGGQAIPIHPLDLNLENNPTQCLGSFQPIEAGAEGPTYDAIFGMAFLRNVYLLINYGDFVDDSDANELAAPYVQMIATTNADDAKAEFARTRSGLGGSMSKRKIAIGVGVGVGLALLVGVALGTFCCCRRRRRNALFVREKLDMNGSSMVSYSAVQTATAPNAKAADGEPGAPPAGWVQGDMDVYAVPAAAPGFQQY